MTGVGQLSGTASKALYQGARPAARSDPELSALALLGRFPPRVSSGSWSATAQPREQVMARLLDEPPFATAAVAALTQRRRGLAWVLDWLEQQPGESWQDRWLASGADAEGNIAWRRLPTAGPAGTSRGRTDTEHGRLALARGMSLLVAGDVIRPSLAWVITPSTPRDLVTEIAQGRDPRGFARLLA